MSVLGPLSAFMLILYSTSGFCGTPNSGSGNVSDTLAYSWDTFAPIGLCCIVLIWWSIHSFLYNGLVNIIEIHSLFLKENRRAVDKRRDNMRGGTKGRRLRRGSGWIIE